MKESTHLEIWNCNIILNLRQNDIIVRDFLFYQCWYKRLNFKQKKMLSPLKMTINKKGIRKELDWKHTFSNYNVLLRLKGVIYIYISSFLYRYETQRAFKFPFRVLKILKAKRKYVCISENDITLNRKYTFSFIKFYISVQLCQKEFIKLESIGT